MEKIILTEQDYTSLRYNIYGLSKKDRVIKKFPAIAAWQEYKEPVKFNDTIVHESEVDQIIRYIILLYDPGSPYLKIIPDLIQRKMAVAVSSEVGWEPNKEGYFSKLVDSIMKCKVSVVNKMIVRFVHSFNNPDYSLLVTGYESLYRKQTQILDMSDVDYDDTSEKIKGVLYDQAKKLVIDLKELAAAMLNDVNPYLREDLFRFIDQQSLNQLRLTPEQMASRWGEL